MGSTILCWQLFSFRILKISFYYLLAFIISLERLAHCFSFEQCIFHSSFFKDLSSLTLKNTLCLVTFKILPFFLYIVFLNYVAWYLSSILENFLFNCNFFLSLFLLHVSVFSVLLLSSFNIFLLVFGFLKFEYNVHLHIL